MTVTTFHWVAALQQAAVGVVLLWAAAVKLLAPSAPAAAARSALARLIGRRGAGIGYRLIGGAELVVAGALLLPPAARIEAAGATVLAAGFLGYLCYAKVAAPGSSCGCMSTRPTPVRGRGLFRAGVLLVASLVATQTTLTWPHAITDNAGPAIVVVLGEIALIAALSPELDRRWLLPLRRLRVRISHPLATHPTAVPLESTLRLLYRSDAYRSVAAHLRSDVRESWDEDGWRLVTFGARRHERPVTAVFAVPRTGADPGSVRVAVVDEPDLVAR